MENDRKWIRRWVGIVKLLVISYNDNNKHNNNINNINKIIIIVIVKK